MAGGARGGEVTDRYGTGRVEALRARVGRRCVAGTKRVATRLEVLRRALRDERSGRVVFAIRLDRVVHPGKARRDHRL